MIDCMVLYDKLAQFETSAEIAEFLEEYGIKGKRMVAKKCALSIYFQTLSGFKTLLFVLTGDFLIRIRGMLASMNAPMR